MAPAGDGRASRRRDVVTTSAAQALGETHRQFDRELAPTASVESGGVLMFDCPGPALALGATAAEAATLDHSHPHPLVGPVEIEGAEPGDAVAIDILRLELPQPYGHSLIIPGTGLLEEFEELYVQNFSFAGGFAYLRPDVRVPLEPFCGVMGLAPAEPGSHSTIPPRRVGGNLDIRDLTAGASLILPVEVEGGLFSCGDGHAAQGDGEVCVTAIETAIRATLRFRLLKGLEIPMPRFVTPAARVPRGDKGRLGACGVGDDLMEACRCAVRGLISQLTSECGLSREEAYVLCSVAGDLRLNEIVNFPNHVVTAQLPLDVFCGPSVAGTDDISPT